MDWLNYHHLYYAWVVAREGSIDRASKRLRLASPTISGQIHRLEAMVGHKLFVRRGRHIVPTEMGEIAARYGDRIFGLGQELLDAFHGKEAGPRPFVVGISDVLARSIVHRILEPVFAPALGLRVICKESGSAEAFDAELAAHTVDVVLSNAPARRGSHVRMYSHALGECGTSWFAAPALAARHRGALLRSLADVPLLLPTTDSIFRRDLDRWFHRNGLAPTIAAEVDDAALACALGEKGVGVFAAADVIEDEIRKRYRVKVIGRSQDVRQRFFAISVERELRHPGVVAICETARASLFD